MNEDRQIMNEDRQIINDIYKKKVKYLLNLYFTVNDNGAFHENYVRTSMAIENKEGDVNELGKILRDRHQNTDFFEKYADKLFESGVTEENLDVLIAYTGSNSLKTLTSSGVLTLVATDLAKEARELVKNLP